MIFQVSQIWDKDHILVTNFPGSLPKSLMVFKKELWPQLPLAQVWASQANRSPENNLQNHDHPPLTISLTQDNPSLLCDLPGFTSVFWINWFSNPSHQKWTYTLCNAKKLLKNKQTKKTPHKHKNMVSLIYFRKHTEFTVGIKIPRCIWGVSSTQERSQHCYLE